MKRDRKPIAIDLFAGCGGLTTGLKQAGFSVIGAVEIEPVAVETYSKNHRNVRVWARDIRAIAPRELLETLKIKPGELDLLAGCPPCQGFSKMTERLRRGSRKSDSRNDLVLEFLRFVRAMRPRSLMLENVPGLLHDPRFRNLTEQLYRLGYACHSAVLDAADYGVPQRRNRLILVGGRAGPVPFGRSTTKAVTVFDAFKELDRLAKDDILHNLPEFRSTKIKNLIRKIPRNGGSRVALGARQQLQCHRKCNGFKDVYGRMAWRNVSPTITCGCVNPSKGRFLHPTKNRAITLREAAVLQSFPLSYYFSLRRGKYFAAQMIGNALPPEFIRRHALAIRRYLESTHN